MHFLVHRLIAPLLLLFALGGTCFAQGVGGTHLFFPAQPVTAGGTGQFHNILIGPGSVSITGTGNGGDQISGVAVINGFVYANNFSGTDIGAKVNNAITYLGAGGGTILIPPGTYPFNTTIQCPINADIPVIIQGAGSSSDYNFAGTVLQYTGIADAVNQMMTTGHQNSRGCELRDLTLDGEVVGPSNPNSNNIGFHIGGTIYSKTQDVMVRNFGNCIELDNEPDPAVGGHWTERYDFHQTSFSACLNNEIYFHQGSGGNNSFMHGKMDIHTGLFDAENGIFIDGGGQATGCDFEINGNMSPNQTPNFTGSLIKLVGNSYLFGKTTLLPECMNASLPCTRFDIDPTSHVSAQVFGGIPGAFLDKLPAGSDLSIAYADSRFVGTAISTCTGTYGFASGTTGQSAEMFTVQNWGTFAAGPLSIASRYIGNATTRLYNLAASSCSNNPSISLAKETIYAGGAPFTVTETCHPTAVVGGGTVANPQYPQGSTTYSVVNNSPSTAAPEIWFSFQNTITDPAGKVVGPLSPPGICF